MDKLTLILPIKTVSEINVSEHWTKKAKRHKQQQFFVRILLEKHKDKVTLPCTIRLIRLSTRLLDCDNLPTSMKYVQDEIAAQLVPEKVALVKRKGKKMYLNKGMCDNDPRLRWEYYQEKNANQGVRIEIESLTPSEQGQVPHE